MAAWARPHRALNRSRDRSKVVAVNDVKFDK
jgi:hypothetical protein